MSICDFNNGMACESGAFWKNGGECGPDLESYCNNEENGGVLGTGMVDWGAGTFFSSLRVENAFCIFDMCDKFFYGRTF